MPAPLAFHVLGPLQVRRRRMRLWCSAGRGNGCCSPRFWWSTAGWCSVDGLTQALWGDRPPATARHQVGDRRQQAPQGLRRGGAGPGIIATCAPGYLVAGGWLDARWLRGACQQAHDALAAGDREEATGSAARWAGSLARPALSGIDRPFAEIEAPGWRNGGCWSPKSTSAWNSILGRHEEAVGDLLALVRAHRCASGSAAC